MDKKYKAYELWGKGHSYGEIAKKLGIGRTTAFDYVKEVSFMEVAMNRDFYKKPKFRITSENIRIASVVAITICTILGTIKYIFSI